MSPNKPKTPTVSVRIEPELWKRAVKKAAERAEPGGASGVVRRALLAYVEDE